jgi:frataxin-like iron-binding protein CyaY
LPELVEILYHAILEKVEKNTKVIAIDIVKDIQLQPDIQKLLTLSPKDYGIFMINRQTNISGVVLPDTQGITDIK